MKKLHFAPAASDVPQLFSWENSAGFVPPIPMNPNIAVVVPVLATVRMDATLCVP
jgi:hypothetical protein